MSETITDKCNFSDLLLGDVLGHVGLLDEDVHLGNVVLSVLVHLGLKCFAQILCRQLQKNVN